MTNLEEIQTREWRTGTKVPYTLYIGDDFVGSVRHSEVADYIVESMNEVIGLRAENSRLIAERDAARTDGITDRERLIRDGFAFDSDRDCDAAKYLIGVIDVIRWDRTLLRQYLAAAEQRAEATQKIVDEVDDCLVVDWVGPRKDGDYKKALSDMKTVAIDQHSYFEYEEKIKKLRGVIVQRLSEDLMEGIELYLENRDDPAYDEIGAALKKIAVLVSVPAQSISPTEK